MTDAGADDCLLASYSRCPLCYPLCLFNGLSVLVVGAATALVRVGRAVLPSPCYAVLPTRRKFNFRGRIGTVVSFWWCLAGQPFADLTRPCIFVVVQSGLDARERPEVAAVQVGRR